MLKEYHNQVADATRSPLAFLAGLWPIARPPSLPANLAPALPAEFPCPPTDVCQQIAGNRAATVRQPSRKSSQTDVLISALIRAGRPLSVSELAEAMGCCRGEASKRVTAAGKLVKARREGRCKLISVGQMSLPEWQRRRAAA